MLTLTDEAFAPALDKRPRPGRPHAIEYLSRGGRDASAVAWQSEPRYLWLEGRSGKPLERAAAKGGVPAGGSGKIVGYTSCTITQQNDLVAAPPSHSTTRARPLPA